MFHQLNFHVTGDKNNISRRFNKHKIVSSYLFQLQNFKMSMILFYNRLSAVKLNSSCVVNLNRLLYITVYVSVTVLLRQKKQNWTRAVIE